MPKTKLQEIFRLMRRKRGVTRQEIWDRVEAYQNFSMDKLVEPYGIKYKKRIVNGRMHYYIKQ